MSESMCLREIDGNDLQLIDPDPFGLFLTWLGAVGSVASLVALYEQREQSKEQDRLRDISQYALAEIVEHMCQIESDLALLDGQLGKMDLLIQLAHGGSSNGQPMMTPQSLDQASFRFGGVRLNLPGHMLKEWARFHRETSTITKRIGTAIHTLLPVLSEYRIHVSPETYHQLIEFRNSLNHILDSGNYVSAITSCRESIAAGREVMSELRSGFRG